MIWLNSEEIYKDLAHPTSFVFPQEIPVHSEFHHQTICAGSIAVLNASSLHLLNKLEKLLKM